MRKKIPLIGGIINLIESLKGDIGIIENTDVATHSIPAGSYVIWHNELYKASSAIAVDDALSASNLTAVSGGAANELNVQEIDTSTGNDGIRAFKINNLIFLQTVGNGISVPSTGYALPAALKPKMDTGAPCVRYGGPWVADSWIQISTTGVAKIMNASGSAVASTATRFSLFYEAADA